jgi:hypothetical protein
MNILAHLRMRGGIFTDYERKLEHLCKLRVGPM